MTYRIESCAKVDPCDLHTAMVAAFSDYIVPMKPTFEQFVFMLRHRGYSDIHSHVALTSRSRIASFWLCSAPDVFGNAYTIATGTLPEHRRKRLLARMLSSVSKTLKTDGATVLSLEVIEGNIAARTAYGKLGFTPKKDLLCWDVPPETQPKPDVSGKRVEPLTLDGLPKIDDGFFDFTPTPQNSLAAMSRIREDVRVFACKDEGEIVGWAVLIRPSNTISQLAVRRDCRCRGVGAALFSKLAEEASGATLKVINADASDDTFACFFEKRGACEFVRQLEMNLKIGP